MKENNLLQIPEGRIEQVIEQMDEHEPELDIFIQDQLRQMKSEQPLLHEYLRLTARQDTVRSIPFVIGAIAMYKMIGDKIKSDQLQVEHFTIANATIEDQARTEEERGENFKWFYDKLKEDYPELTDYLADAIFNIGDPEDRSDFALGVFCTSIPFYMREEAKILSKKIPF